MPTPLMIVLVHVADVPGIRWALMAIAFESVTNLSAAPASVLSLQIDNEVSSIAVE